jgi:nucleoside-specific outer membrane channel protein Tsx
MKRMCTSLMLAGSMFAGGQAMAEGLLQWQNNSLTYLYGKDFQVNPRIQQTVTFEHADAWTYGDNFFFFDKIFYNGGKDFSNGPNTTTVSSAHASRWARCSTRRSSSARSKTSWSP